MSSPIVPVPDDTTRRVPVIGYIVDNYSGHAGFPTVCLRVNDMLDDGIEVTEAMVDHLFQHTTDDWLTQFRQAHQAARERCRAAEVRTGFTYFIQNGDRIKIGYSTNPRQRVLDLSLRESNIMGVVASKQRFERVCHAMWDEIRIDDTEWFHATDELLAWIDGIATKWHYRHGSREVTPSIERAYVNLLRAMHPS